MLRYLAALLLIAAAPAAAQDQGTPTENLDCAIWAAYLIGTTEDADASQGLGFALSWFVGLYEGQTGEPIDAAMRARVATMTQDDLVAVEKRCIPRMQAYGDRLTQLGDELQAMGK
jgi:hypothetical protein